MVMMLSLGDLDFIDLGRSVWPRSRAYIQLTDTEFSPDSTLSFCFCSSNGLSGFLVFAKVLAQEGLDFLVILFHLGQGLLNARKGGLLVRLIRGTGLVLAGSEVLNLLACILDLGESESG